MGTIEEGAKCTSSFEGWPSNGKKPMDLLVITNKFHIYARGIYVLKQYITS